MIDEAAQGTEPEILIPLSVIAPPEECTLQNPIFVMAGDQKQLGPRTASRQAFYEISLFERLFSRPIYSEHPLSRQGIAKLGGSNASRRITELTEKLLVCDGLSNNDPFTNIYRIAIYSTTIYKSYPEL